MHPFSRVLGLSAAILLTSCDPSENRMMKQEQSTAVATAPTPEEIEAKFRQNPSPKQAYRVILDVSNAPGPFASIEGFAQYAAPDCTYVINEAAGATAHPEQRIPVTYTKQDDGTYAGIVHTDAMLDEDYFGKGICRWGLVVVSAQMRATGAQGETRFFASLDREALLGGKPQTRVHERKRYPRDPVIADFSSLGLDPPSDDVFPLTLTSEIVRHD